MSDILQLDISCKTAQEFLSLVLPSGEFLGGKIENPTWLFRGQGRDYELIPSIFRKDKRSVEKFKKFTDRNIAESYEQLLLAERDFIDRFFWIADKRGFQIPDDSQELRSKLSEFRLHNFHVTQKNGEWLSSGNILSLISMVQHYGIPTRLLDWSLQPLIAAFFAAEGGSKRFDWIEKKFSDPEVHIVFWAFYFPLFGIDIHFHTKEFSLKGVTAPSSSNPNLKAQQGVFTLAHHWYTNEKDGFYLPLDKVLEKIQGSPYSKDVDGCVLQKITLPVSESFNLLSLLAKLEITSSSVYPGYHSIVDDMKMQKEWLDYAKILG
jgi:hypothetical protein